jgi:hypothetical protein
LFPKTFSSIDYLLLIFFLNWIIVSGVENLNGAKVLGRIIRVDHVSKYKKKEEEDEQELQKKREERGVQPWSFL